MKLVFYVCVLMVLLLQLKPANTQLSGIRTRMRKYLKWSNIPDEFLGVVASLDRALHILRCLRFHKRGNCYQSDYCAIVTRKVTLAVKLALCKHPWLLRIDIKLPRDWKKFIPGPNWLKKIAFAKVAPIIIRLDHRKAEGVTRVVSNSRVGVGGIGVGKLLGIKLNIYKAYAIFDLTVRWDCRRPLGASYKNTALRLKYNTAYNDGRPGNDMNKLYYKLKIGYELKKKKFPCFCYRTDKIDILVSKQGHFFEGPASCKSDWGPWTPPYCTFFMRCEGMFQRRVCVGRSIGGPPCSGASSRRCPPAWGFQRGGAGRRVCP